jgi:hypothetical protein
MRITTVAKLSSQVLLPKGTPEHIFKNGQKLDCPNCHVAGSLMLVIIN